MIRVPATPSLIRWASQRSGQDREKLEKKFKKLPEWESGKLLPTAIQLQEFARRVHVPYSYMFLYNPPKEKLPIADYRTKRSESVGKFSPNLLDVIYAAQIRQYWYQDFAETETLPKVDLIASAKISSSPTKMAREMHDLLNFDIAKNKPAAKNFNRLRILIDLIEKQGILVMISGIVDDDKSRKLNLDEFRGFTLSDPLAPVIFVNGQDCEAGQLFTLVHEFGHLLLGKSGISNSEITACDKNENRIEVWCKKFAVEFLVPLEELTSTLVKGEAIEYSLKRLTRKYRVSKQVILNRLFEMQQITRKEYIKYQRALNVELTIEKSVKSGERNLALATRRRVGNRFAEAVIVSTLSGQTLYRDAYKMLCIWKTETFNELAELVGVKN